MVSAGVVDIANGIVNVSIIIEIEDESEIWCTPMYLVSVLTFWSIYNIIKIDAYNNMN